MGYDERHVDIRIIYNFKDIHTTKMTLPKKNPNPQDWEEEYDISESLPNNPPWLEDSDDNSDEDEWFYTSIHRYKQLCTYSLICDPTAIDINTASRKVVVAGLRSLGTIQQNHSEQKKFEVAIYLIPEKLTVESNKEKEGLLSGL